ncbi:hypothetical protein EPUS_07096 [Endocarpon pusillum Z07020]|uniref:Mitochondrial F1F0 ATP synthase subunit Atp14 n=1 Tax=Endocarpon pusillum (strain Z07020 / HMAS-L-300199) TaxID=1263415 RepID=U1G6J8_ENDPU|nr:uncharacterized protein EPUS_07096 [Endocarpon pusillum Z07020]ERF73002.1 hypothetical protein EPUS_07096 [Endocarpon pusillum Z07020]
MTPRSLRASSSLAARIARNTTPLNRRQFVAATAIRQPDIIQDLYLRELRAYKPPPAKPADAEGHVQKFTMPKPPKSPEETSITNQVQEYENSAVEVEGQASSGEAQEPEGDYFEDLKDLDEEQPAAH